ncbi:MAG: DUF3352 domain-containing protein [Cyanobacteria bacterium]|nr:DUF3352 domain-containing protein [Cyanobacteriota bacterium]MDW8201530.1 DUF3352 domain-containing protein [Cyanobacteriota bacterium SKYGB_h_bin112]
MKISNVFSQAVLSIGSAIAIGFCFGDRLLAQTEPMPTPPLPSDVAFSISISTKLETWQDLKRFHLFREFYLAAFTDLELPENLDIEADILSWLGDRAQVVVLSRTGNGNPAQELQDKLAVIVPIRDMERYNAAWKKLQANDTAIVERSYRGITIQESRDTTLPGCQLSDSNNIAPPDLPTISSAPLTDTQTKVAQTEQAVKPPTNDSTLLETCIDLVAATMPGYAVYAMSPKAVETVIDAQVDSTPLDPKLARTLQRPAMSGSLMAIYIDLPKTVDWVKAFAALQASSDGDMEAVPPVLEPGKTKPLIGDSTSSLSQGLPAPVPSPDAMPPGTAEPSADTPVNDPVADIDRFFAPLLRDYDAADFFIFAQSEGVRLQGNTYYKESNPERADAELPGANSILRLVPGSTYALGNSRNLKQQWQEIVEAFEQDDDLRGILATIRSGFKASTSLDLDQDVIAWMDGEFGGFVYPTKRGPIAGLDPTFQVGMAFMIQTSDRPTAEAAIRKLEESIVFKLGEDFGIKRRTIAGQAITSWEFTLPYYSYSVLAYGWVNQDTLLVTQGTENIEEILKPRGKLLPDYYTFITATNTLPRPNQGYAYVNMGSVLALVNTIVPSYARADEDFQLGMRILATIRSFSSTSSTTADYDQGDVLIVLAPVLPKQESQVGQLAAMIRRRAVAFPPLGNFGR